ncbi:MAG TPA: C40 family peptidase [Sphingobacteriaceae bacterium]
MKQSFAFCRLSAIPLRAEPSDRSEMVSQLLYGDHVEILEREEKWCRVRMGYDDYEGWLDPKQLLDISESESGEFGKVTDILGLQACHRVRDEETGESLHLMPGSSLPGYRHPFFGAGGTRLSLEGEALKQRPDAFAAEVEAVSRFYLNAPYLWGGKTPFGIDCSGLTQIVFKQFGIRLKRDASQQALQGDLVAFLQEARTGDLAFFDNAEGRITHVGIMLGNAGVIHASGRVRIDAIDDQGIFNRELNRYTHNLRVIKRFA